MNSNKDIQQKKCRCYCHISDENKQYFENAPSPCEHCVPTPPVPLESEEECPNSQRVDGNGHSWGFDGDDPYVICYWCKEVRGAISNIKISPQDKQDSSDWSSKEKELFNTRFGNTFDYEPEHTDYWLDRMVSLEATARAKGKVEGAEEYKQFVLNILDGIDKADKEMDNPTGGTKAIRFALLSRIIE